MVRKKSANDGRLDRAQARALMERLNEDAARIALRFQLRYQSIEAERPHVKSRYGICYSDGRIQIRLRHAKTGRPLRYSSLVNTLCHELAHLRHMNHGPRFKAYYLRILEWARSEGIYRPGTAGARAAFDPVGCATPPLPAAPRGVPRRHTTTRTRLTEVPALTASRGAPPDPAKPVQLTLF